MGVLTGEQIESMGFAHVGKNARLSDKASYYNCANISIGNNVRIDDFCVLSAGVGGIEFGNFIHIAVYGALIGAGRITLQEYSNISSRVSIYSSNDDYSGNSMTNPMVPAEFTNVIHADINIGRHVVIGAGSVVLPGVTLSTGVAIGALSLVAKSCAEFGIYSGVPVRRIKELCRDLLLLEQQFIDRAKIYIDKFEQTC